MDELDEDMIELDALCKKAVYACTDTIDYEHLKGQIDEMAKTSEPVMLAPPHIVRFLCQAWQQLFEMQKTLSAYVHIEHSLLREITELKTKAVEKDEQHADDLDRITGKVLQTEQENRSLRAWKERVKVDFQIPDTYE